MKLSISNIAWSAEHDEAVYTAMKEYGFTGLEIAPTRWFPDKPYEHIDEAAKIAKQLKAEYGFSISSMQSIWYGVQNSIFGTDEERDELIKYTCAAVDFAVAVGCGNLVFGCPRNRVIPDPEMLPIAIDFFREIGKYAEKCGTVIALEPNPPIYNTNFMNTTEEAFSVCREISCAGVKVNVDIGTMIKNNESADILEGNEELINHIHISEPFLERVKERELHKKITELNYDRYVSVEMKNQNDIDAVCGVLRYVEEVFS